VATRRLALFRCAGTSNPRAPTLAALTMNRRSAAYRTPVTLPTLLVAGDIAGQKTRPAIEANIEPSTRSPTTPMTNLIPVPRISVAETGTSPFSCSSQLTPIPPGWGYFRESESEERTLKKV